MRTGWVLLGVLVSSPVVAADADPFAPSSGLALGQGTVQGEPTVLGEPGFHGGLYAFSANDLAVFAGDAPAPYVGAVVPDDRLLAQVVGTTVHGGWTFGERIRVDAFVPFYPYAQTDAWQGPAFGDARLQATIGLRDEGPLRVAVTPKLELPTGAKGAYLTRGTTGTITAALGGPILEDRLEWLTNVGLALSPNDVVRDRGFGSSIDLLGGVVYHAGDNFRVGYELNGSIGLAKGDADRPNHRGDTSLFAQALHPSGLALTGAASVGIGGVGAPDYRVFSAVTYGPINPDRDHDTIHDRDDGCPLDPEDFDQFEDADGCPDLDNDKDGVADLVDVCRNEPEDVDSFGDADGCPDPDNDHDYVLDADDQCRDVAGEQQFAGCPDTDADGLQDTEDQCPTEAGPKETGGCPDKDADLVPDFRDKCPTEPRPADEDPGLSDGCPKTTYVAGKQIRIGEKVFFETGKAIIKPASYGLLDTVAGLMKQNLWIDLIEVGGHTDDQGSDVRNLRLSDARSAAVRKYLENAGVGASRLVSKGYGEGSPIDTNRTAVGRANNRRVEFNILKQSPPSEAVPRPGASGAVNGQPETGVDNFQAGLPARFTVRLVNVSYADVYIDDVKLNKAAPFEGLPLPPGEHTISVVNIKSSLMYQQKVLVKSGEDLVIEAK
jgi:OOP family OmpA-OmpF porin